MRARHGVLGLFLLFAASAASAEVSDKIPTIQGFWGWAAGFNIAALLFSVWRTPLGLAVVPLAALYAWAGHEMVSDRHLGPAILQEQGVQYVQHVYASGALGALGPMLIVGLIAVYRDRAALRRAA